MKCLKGRWACQGGRTKGRFAFWEDKHGSEHVLALSYRIGGRHCSLQESKIALAPAY